MPLIFFYTNLNFLTIRYKIDFSSYFVRSAITE